MRSNDDEVQGIVDCFIGMAERGILFQVEDIVNSSLRCAKREGVAVLECDLRLRIAAFYRPKVEACLSAAINCASEGDPAAGVMLTQAQKYAKLGGIDILDKGQCAVYKHNIPIPPVTLID